MSHDHKELRSRTMTVEVTADVAATLSNLMNAALTDSELLHKALFCKEIEEAERFLDFADGFKEKLLPLLDNTVDKIEIRRGRSKQG